MSSEASSSSPIDQLGRGILGYHTRAVAAYTPPPGVGGPPPPEAGHGHGMCSQCGAALSDEWDICGIIWGVAFFPCGMYCCFKWKRRHCSGCGAVTPSDCC